MVFEAVLQLLEDFGFFSVVIPFLLIFALFYAMILKTGVLGTLSDAWTKTTAAIISMAAAFLVIVYTPVIDALRILIPQAGFLIVAVMLFLMLVAFLVPNWSSAIGEEKWWIVPAVIVLIVIFLGMVGASVGESVPALYGFTQFLIGKIPLEFPEEAMNTLMAFAIVIGIPLIVVGIIMWKSSSSGSS